ncbi:MAG: RpiB/LacA/LacB family sugar-phosphate isomerase [Acidobacteria bacterium]|nr:RpiB/LacA/LacB family sugar-phosphate isomerase [Acidobacteriota bacterium]
MARFAMITEADARVLPEGSTVELLPRGHITPLAADTLRDRRITVIHADRVSEDDGASLVPEATVRRVIIGSDHTGVALRQHLVTCLRGRGLAVQTVGPEGTDPPPVDYPDIAEQVGLAVVRKDADAGIVIDGAGLGSTMAANKVAGVRAALGLNETLARYAREHNGANVLALGASLISRADAEAIVAIFLTTPMTEPRYIRRLVKLQRLERRP